MRFLSADKRDQIDLQFTSSLCLMSDYQSLHLLPSAAGESLSDDDWMEGHQSVSTAEAN